MSTNKERHEKASRDEDAADRVAAGVGGCAAADFW